MKDDAAQGGEKPWRRCVGVVRMPRGSHTLEALEVWGGERRPGVDSAIGDCGGARDAPAQGGAVAELERKINGSLSWSRTPCEKSDLYAGPPWPAVRSSTVTRRTISSTGTPHSRTPTPISA